MYENMTYESILARMLARVSPKIDKREGSVIFDTHSPTAIELQILYLQLDAILRETYGDTASRDYLIRRCAERGIVPYEATQAVLRGEFEPSTVDVTGRRFSIGTVNYVVTGRLEDGDWAVTCETAGEVGNRQLGSLIPIDYIDGLERAQLVEVLIPGEEEEETEALRSRYFASFDEKAFGGNTQDYLEKTGALPGVGSVKVARVWNGDIEPAALIPTETVTTWYDGVVKSLSPDVAAWLTPVYTAASEKKLTVGGTVLLTILNADFDAASETLVQTVQTAIDPTQNAGEGLGLAPIGHVVTVQSAAEVPVTVKATLTFDTGFGWDNLQSAIETAVSGYLLELREQWAGSAHLVVRVSQVETRILAVPGVVDITGTTLNDEADNLTLGPYEVPVFGGVGP